MKSLISQNPIYFLNPQFSPSFFIFRFPLLSRETITLLHDPHKRPIFLRGPLKLFPVKATRATANSTSYGGWDDSRIGGESINLGESTHLRDFLVSVGIDDKKHFLLFLAGVVCAFAISRVRVSSIIVFPASVLLFAVGFLIGFVRGGSSSEFRVDASKRKGKEESFRVYDDKLMILLGFFDRVHVKVDNLKKRFETAIDVKEIELEDLRNYVNELESIELLASGSRKDLEATLEGLCNSSSVVVENQLKSKKNKEDLDAIGFELLQLVGGWFREKSVSPKTNKAKEKDTIKQRTFENIGYGRAQGNSSSQAVEEGIHNYVHTTENRNQVLSQGLTVNSIYWDIDARNVMSSENVTSISMEMDETDRNYTDIKERHEHKRFRSVNNESETRKSSGNLLRSGNFRRRDAEASFVQKQMFIKSSRAFSSFNRMASDDERYTSKFREDRPNTDLNYNNQFMPGSEFDSRSSAMSNDLLFDSYLTEANDLLRQAKECIRSRDIDERAEVMLYKSAKLLTDVIAMKPMSLLAIGQLGNTYLLHGEIKLKISRELRYLLSRRDPLPLENENHVNMLKGLASDLRSKDKIAPLLIDVCEECEELLVEAGRKYRLALSIDGNDVRALYNWGLALSFRAQLIADIGPEAAFDADKVFMAAIDKFEAMMSKGNIYAPDALLRWGMVSQQRSRLRPTNSKQKVKLLQQARRLYEDALQMDSENLQIKEALSSCMSELNLRL